MKILVIGATGYVGGRIAHAFASAGSEVVGFCRDDRGKAALEAQGLGAFCGDVDDAAALGAQARAADATVFAARVMEQGSTREREQRIVGGLLDALVGSDKAFVLTSGTGVIGQDTRGEWSEDSFAEDTPFTPPEVLLKRVETERMVLDSATRGVRGIVVRPPMIWGHELPSHALHMLSSAKALGAVCYVGRGLNCYTNVHVDDLAELYRLAVERAPAGALYHATQGEIPNRWMAERIAGVLSVGIRSVSVEEGAELWGDYNARSVMGASSRSISPRARRELGWRPTRHDMLEDIEALVAEAVNDPGELQRVFDRRPK